MKKVHEDEIVSINVISSHNCITNCMNLSSVSLMSVINLVVTLNEQ